MAKDRENLRFLLVNTRLAQKMIDHERGCLARAAGLRLDQIQVLDATKDDLDPSVLDGIDGVFIGGTGDYSVANDRPAFFEPLCRLTMAMLEQEVPSMGLCYGFHLMAHALGGRVETREDLEETGTYEVQLTEGGRQDPLLNELPGRFLAQQGHHDVVLEMPDSVVRLAASERCYWQAFRIPGKPFYGLQFHPELGREDFMLRMQTYADSYAATPEVYAAIDARVKETNIQEVIRRFIERFVL